MKETIEPQQRELVTIPVTLKARREPGTIRRFHRGSQAPFAIRWFGMTALAGHLRHLLAAAAASREPQQEAALAKDVERTNKQCGSGFTVKFDWTGIPPGALNEFSAAGYCDAALEGIRRICEESLGKDAVKQKIKSMTCGFGGERAISLTNGSLEYTINFNSTNDADFVYAYLQNSL